MLPLTKLYQVITNHKASFDEKIMQLLDIGRQHLDLEHAWIADINGDQYTVQYALSNTSKIAQGAHLSLSETFCRNTFAAQGIKASNHVSESPLSRTPCYPCYGLEAFIGVPLVFNDRPTGILSFGNNTPREQAFVQSDYEFIVFLSYWIGSETSKNKQLTMLQSQQAELAHQQALLDEVGQLARVGTWEMDLIAGKIYWSNTTRDIHEVAADYEPELETAINFYKEGENRERISALVKVAMRDGSAFEGEFEIVTPTGKVKWVATQGKAEITGGQCVRLYGGFQDITKQVFYRRELEQGHAELSAALEARSTFLANMSHEIRTPINGVIGSLQVMDKSTLNDKQKHFLSLASHSAETLLDQVNDVLDFAKIDANQIELEHIPFNINELTQSCIRMVEISAQKKQLALDAHLDKTQGAMILGDPTRVKQICSNLLSNAIKFTEHGSVSITTYLKRQSKTHGLLSIDIQDTGIGLSDAQLPNLFLPFQQADSSTTRRFGGTGLGLTICQKLAHAMNGHVAVHSQLGQGSHFILEVPVEIANTRPSVIRNDSAQTVIQAKSADKLVLVVEDNEINQAVVSEMLKLRDIPHHMANDGLEALEKIEDMSKTKQRYQLILMDCQMPNMDGYQATRNIRQLQHAMAKTPIIALTANAMKGDKEKCLLAGMTDYLAKPIEQQSFYSMLDQYLWR